MKSTTLLLLVLALSPISLSSGSAQAAWGDFLRVKCEKKSDDDNGGAGCAHLAKCSKDFGLTAWIKGTQRFCCNKNGSDCVNAY